MADDGQFGMTPGRDGPTTGEEWLTPVAVTAAAASSAPVDLLGDYLPMLADAAIHGRRPEPWQLDAVRELGRRAAAQGVSARTAVDLYLSAAWRLWGAAAPGGPPPPPGEGGRGAPGGGARPHPPPGGARGRPPPPAGGG